MNGMNIKPTTKAGTKNIMPLLHAVNFLHLNSYKKAWTWVADIYAVSLILLALTGLFMIRGKRKMRGILLTIVGSLVPLVFLFILI